MYNSLRTCSAFEGAEVSTREAKKIGKKKEKKNQHSIGSLSSIVCWPKFKLKTFVRPSTTVVNWN